MPSVEAVAAASRMSRQRRRYDVIMSDRKPQIVDKEFMTELRSRLDRHYLAGLSAKEAQLADAEKRRAARLLQQQQQLSGGYQTLQGAAQSPSSHRSSIPRGGRRSSVSASGDSRRRSVSGKSRRMSLYADQLEAKSGAHRRVQADEDPADGSGQLANSCSSQLLCELSVDQLYNWASRLRGSRDECLPPSLA